MRDFHNLLDGSPNHRIMCVYGGAGIGKSHLLQLMQQTCAERRIRWAMVSWGDGKFLDYRDVMRRIRDGTQPELFTLFNDRVNTYSKPQYTPQVEIKLTGPKIADVEVLNNGRIQQSGIDVHVGPRIGDVYFQGLRPDLDVSEDEVVTNLSEAFRICLRAVIASGPLVVMLDGLEKADKRVLGWLHEEILLPVCSNQLANLLFVLAGRESLMLDKNPRFFDFAVTYELQPFKDEHVFEYVKRRGIQGEETIDTVAMMILGQRIYNPLQIAQMVNDFVQYRRRARRA